MRRRSIADARVVSSTAVATALALRCRCGAVTGEVADVSPAACNHAICYCRDCRAFAHALEADILDAYGGTDIVQVAQSQVRLTGGREHLRCLRLSPRGLHRWYAGCCRTPIGNTQPRLPYVGLPRVCLVDATDAVVGPTVGVLGRSAPGGVPPGAHARAPLRMIGHATKLMLRWWIGGKGRPSPYFTDDGTPRAVPEVLAPPERERLHRMDAQVGSSAASRAS